MRQHILEKIAAPYIHNAAKLADTWPLNIENSSASMAPKPAVNEGSCEEPVRSNPYLCCFGLYSFGERGAIMKRIMEFSMTTKG